VNTEKMLQRDTAGLRYGTVSHVWGTADMLKLQQANLEQFLESIPFEPLVIKFREIIQLAYSVGLTYIWIDTLCIIQNSTTDWRREAERMADVYRNAFINFAATGCSPTDVCLTARNILGLYRQPFVW
jgi:hypothetical protein